MYHMYHFHVASYGGAHDAKATIVRVQPRPRRGVQALVAKEEMVSPASAKALQTISEEVSEACASMLLQNAVDDGIGTVREALRRMDGVMREVCRQRHSRKLLAHSSSDEEEEDGAEDGDKDEEMADVAEEEEEEEDDEDDEEDEVWLRGLLKRSQPWRCLVVHIEA